MWKTISQHVCKLPWRKPLNRIWICTECEAEWIVTIWPYKKWTRSIRKEDLPRVAAGPGQGSKKGELNGKSA